MPRYYLLFVAGSIKLRFLGKNPILLLLCNLDRLISQVDIKWTKKWRKNVIVAWAKINRFQTFTDTIVELLSQESKIKI
jgi:hypothetical protein